MGFSPVFDKVGHSSHVFGWSVVCQVAEALHNNAKQWLEGELRHIGVILDRYLWANLRTKGFLISGHFLELEKHIQDKQL